MTSRPSTAAPILAVLAIVLGAYVGGYFWFGRIVWDEYRVDGSAPAMVREFDSVYVAAMYQPVGNVESWLRGKHVEFWSGQP